MKKFLKSDFRFGFRVSDFTIIHIFYVKIDFLSKSPVKSRSRSTDFSTFRESVAPPTCPHSKNEYDFRNQHIRIYFSAKFHPETPRTGWETSLVRTAIRLQHIEVHWTIWNRIRTFSKLNCLLSASSAACCCSINRNKWLERSTCFSKCARSACTRLSISLCLLATRWSSSVW